MTTWTSTTTWPGDLMRVGDLTSAGLEEVLDLATRMKARPDRWTGALPGASLTCLFETPDTRAGLSMEAAAHRLGMEPIRMRPSDLDVRGGEEFGDAVRILSQYTRAIVARDLPDETLTQLARVADVPVINARSPGHHPCQAVADLLTLSERFDRLEGLVLAYVGAFGNIAFSLTEAAAMTGMEIRLACPPEQAPGSEHRTAAEVLADLHGGRLRLTTDPIEAVSGAHAVYTARWPDLDEHPRLRKELRGYEVTGALFARARPDAIFLHALPAHRDEEVVPAVIDSPRSRVWQQAGNRVPAEEAVIYTLIASAKRDGEMEAG